MANSLKINNTKNSIIFGDTIASSSDDGTSILIGASGTFQKNKTVIGAEIPQDTRPTLALGHSGITVTSISSSNSEWAFTSDIRDKTNIEPLEKASEFLSKIDPVTYVKNARSLYIDENGEFDNKSYINATKKGNRRQVGLLAQNVMDAMITTYGSEKYVKLLDTSDNGLYESYTLSYTSLIPFLIKAVQENEEIIKKLEAYLDKLEKNKETTSE